LEQAGFVNAELVSETGFNSSTTTKGMLFRASKSKLASLKKENSATDSPFGIPSPASGFT
jgi:hypothetical protein